MRIPNNKRGHNLGMLIGGMQETFYFFFFFFDNEIHFT